MPPKPPYDPAYGFVQEAVYEAVQNALKHCLPVYRRAQGSGRAALSGAQMAILTYALERTNGNRSQTAAITGLNRNTVNKLLRVHNLEERFPPVGGKRGGG